MERGKEKKADCHRDHDREYSRRDYHSDRSSRRDVYYSDDDAMSTLHFPTHLADAYSGPCACALFVAARECKWTIWFLMV